MEAIRRSESSVRLLSMPFLEQVYVCTGNGDHSLKERLARWPAHELDRSDGDELLPITRPSFSPKCDVSKGKPITMSAKRIGNAQV